jgi:hypothetical protein
MNIENGSVSVLNKAKVVSKEHRGVTMLEALGWTILVVAVIAGVVTLVSKVFNNWDTSKEVGNIQQIMTNSQGLLKNRGQYTQTNMIKSLVKADAFPDSMIADANGTTAKNVWGGDVTLVPSSNKYTFTLSYAKVPESSCYTMVTKMKESSTVALINGNKVATLDPDVLCVAGDNTLVFTSKS